jgi:hypothetical protein
VKSRAALPRLKVDLPSAANHDFFHTRMLNRRGFLGRCRRDARFAVLIWRETAQLDRMRHPGRGYLIKHLPDSFP